ncbi:MAG: ferritin family protein [Dehalococcoidales bacterium]|jgi:rubrerythrin
MAKEQDATMAGLETALKMEIDGKEFYLKASQASKNQLGKELLKKLAAEEDIHREIFKNIYNAIKSKKGWPDITFTGDGGKNLRTVFAAAAEKLGKNAAPMTQELDAVRTGMDMENKTLDYYKEREKLAAYPAEKQLYSSLSAQEYEHHRVLQDYYEFLEDPEGYFVKTEHTSVDGG